MFHISQNVPKFYVILFLLIYEAGSRVSSGAMPEHQTITIILTKTVKIKHVVLVSF